MPNGAFSASDDDRRLNPIRSAWGFGPLRPPREVRSEVEVLADAHTRFEATAFLGMEPRDNEKHFVVRRVFEDAAH